MDDQSAAELGFEPCSLGRHDFSAVCDVHNLLHGYGVERQSQLHLTAVHAALEFAQSAQSAYEINSLVAAQVLDTQDFIEDESRRDVDIQYTDGVIGVKRAGFGGQAVPFTAQVKGPSSLCRYEEEAYL